VAFQGLINNVLCEHLDQSLIAYPDKNVVYSYSLEEHREHVWLILVKLQEAGHYLKFSKCEFKMQRISFVKFIVMRVGIETELNRVGMIAEWPKLSCHCSTQVFLGFTNFYRRFLSSYSRLMKPITDMP
jgi:hypothetical protein